MARRSLGVDGVSDFNALHLGKHNEEVQLYAFDILALDGDDLRPLPRAYAGDASGFPFSRTYVIRMMLLASKGLPPAWGVSGGIWKASPVFIARVG